MRLLASSALAVVVATGLVAPATATPRSASGTASATPALAAFDPTKVSLGLSLVTGGFTSPLLVTNAHDGRRRLFVVEQAGRIWIIQNGTRLPTPFLDLRSAITSGGERGLLGLAFDPAFTTNRYVYVNFTDLNGNTAIARYTVSSTNFNIVLPNTGLRILTIAQPYPNHNGGNLAFGPDGDLYIGMGDGGSAGDPQNRAQNIDSLLGKILRIDVRHSSLASRYAVPSTNPYVGRSGNDLIWAIGLRNPWRWSFDRSNGWLWIGDVGQDTWEEIDRSLPTASGGAGRGLNYGWRVMEGRSCFIPSSGCSTSGKVLPLAVYPHVVNGSDNCSVTGGFVYRGTASPPLQGGYVFGDFCSGRIWAVSSTASSPVTPTLLRDATATPTLSISSFGEDEAGELYLTDLAGGGVYRLSATAKP
jgi:glucose/arabinose dehydrogenase